MPTLLAKTQEYLVEYEGGALHIARYLDGYAIGMRGKGICGQFKACLKTHSPERAIQTFLRMLPGATWKPCYKPERMPR